MGDDILKTLLIAATAVFEREVSGGDSFFGLGGDSIHAIELGLLIEQSLDVEVDPVLLVSAPDFAAIAAALAR